MRLRKLLAIAVALTALGVGVVGCGDDDDGGGTASNRSFVGTVEGTDAYIALVSDGKQVSGFVCDGTPKAVDVYFWLDSAKITDGSAVLVTRQGDSLGEASFAEGEAGGAVAIDGKPHFFSAEAAGGDAGLYRAIKGEVGEKGTVEAGWIVLADGSQRGGSAQFIDPNAGLKVQPAPFIDPTTDTNVQIPQAGQLRPRKVIDPSGDI